MAMTAAILEKMEIFGEASATQFKVVVLNGGRMRNS
jgi:hypothetical protein